MNSSYTIHTSQASFTLPNTLFKSLDSIPQIDVLIVAVKAYDIEKALENILNFLNEKVLLFTISNGLENAKFIKHLCPNANVFESSIYISCKRKSDSTIINYSESPKLIVSESEVSNTHVSESAIFTFSQLTKFFKRSSINYIITRQSYWENWKKFIITSSVNGACVFFNKKLGDVLGKESCETFLIDCLSEGIKVAGKHGVIFSTSDQNEMINLIQSMGSNCIPSMLWDYRNGKRTEIDYLNGKVCTLGASKGISTPVNQSVCELLKACKLLVSQENYDRDNVE